jgi:hypothetical protein
MGGVGCINLTQNKEEGVDICYHGNEQQVSTNCS